LQQEKVPHKFNPEEFISLTKNLEGHLFPNTYAFAPNVTTQEVIDKLTGEFDQVIKDLNIAPNELNQVLVLASLIEREAGADSERPEIAAILNKRIKNNWALQADAAIQFAVANQRCRIRICDWWPRPLTKADLQIKSPYNTYQNTGLPPFPISNPGKASLSAAVKPKETKNWFYLHGLDGLVHYAETVEQHNQNVCTYLKKDC
ncbi:endolytic transglycosylase MltG, partial [Candidatus Collierbacteria bacterium]|nr:endolytic transglycosylase MltG [Candidatus Collierbacteria bacterium]